MRPWEHPLLLLALAAALSAANCPDLVRETHGAKLEDVHKDLEWLDQFLPSNATEISEAYDLDTHEVWGRFSAAPCNLADLRGALSARSCASLEQAWNEAPAKIKWWPTSLGSVGAERDSEESPLECLGGEERSTWAVLVPRTPDTTHVYIWGHDKREQ